tara:strand:+ start:116 stop:610 length:495 start_codon:yes stop_codon:yes gene_type:complete
MTKEEKRLKANERRRQLYEMNKEKVNARKRELYKVNREKVLERTAIYKSNNKEKISKRMKVYYQDNKDGIRSKQKIYDSSHYDAHKLSGGVHIVYCLPNEDIPYCGMTSNPKYRMRKHRSIGRDTSDWFILQHCSSEKEAREIEANYHKQGYSGRQGKKMKKVA